MLFREELQYFVIILSGVFNIGISCQGIHYGEIILHHFRVHETDRFHIYLIAGGFQSGGK